ncbi:hypothetical protein DSUL_40056 [Desulfovibrionales bacterium]
MYKSANSQHNKLWYVTSVKGKPSYPDATLTMNDTKQHF